MAGFIDTPKKRASSSIAKLSDAGRELVDDLLGEGKPYAAIIEALAATTGEVISRSSLSRWCITDFEPTRRRVEAVKQAAGELAALLEDPTSVEAKFNATAQGLFNVMLPRILEAKTEELPKMLREARMFQQARIQLRRLENDDRRIAMDREKLDLERRELDKRLADFDARQAKARDKVGTLLSSLDLGAEIKRKLEEAYEL